MAEGFEALRVGGEVVPGCAASLDDGLGIVEDAQGEEALAEVEPDPFDGVEFGTVGGQGQEREIVGDGERPFVVPAGAVEHQDGVDVVGQGCGEVGEKQVHDLGVDAGQDEGEVLAGGRAHGGEDVGPLVAVGARAGGALALEPPPVANPALVADPRLVLEPELEMLLGMRGGGASQGLAQPLFLNRSWACGSRRGFAGRAFCREKPRRCSTRVRLEG